MKDCHHHGAVVAYSPAQHAVCPLCLALQHLEELAGIAEMLDVVSTLPDQPRKGMTPEEREKLDRAERDAAFVGRVS